MPGTRRSVSRSVPDTPFPSGERSQQTEHLHSVLVGMMAERSKALASGDVPLHLPPYSRAGRAEREGSHASQ